MWCVHGVFSWFVIMFMCELDLCNECWNFVGMSASSIVKNIKDWVNKWIVGYVTSFSLGIYFSEQSAFILMPTRIYMTKNYEIFRGTTRLKYLSNSSGITPISDLVREISLFQVKVSAQSGTWEQFGCILFLSNLTTESGNVVWIKVVDDFLRFPTL